jgi:hypothetical protein
MAGGSGRTAAYADGRGVDPGPPVLTSGYVAKVCKVAPRTVANWFDKGLLKGYRLPGSSDRRIPAANLVAFMEAAGMGVPADLRRLVSRACLAVGLADGAADALADALGAGWRVDRCPDLFAAGARAAGCGAIVADVGSVGTGALVALAGRAEVAGAVLVAVGCGDDGYDAGRLAAAGWAVCGTAADAAAAVGAGKAG